MHKPKVVFAFEGETAFQFFGAHATLLTVGEPGWRDADVLVVPIKKGLPEFTEPEFQLPAELVSRAAAGRMAVVFDTSREGVAHSDERSDRLHAYIRGLGLPPERCAYVTQDRSYDEAYRSHCREVGWASPLKVLAYDYFIRLIFDLDQEKGWKIYKARRAAFEARPEARDKAFICLNFSPRWNKVMFLLDLMEQGLWDQGFISFGGFERMGRRHVQVEKMRQALITQPGFEDLGAKLSRHIEELDAKGPLLMGFLPRSKGNPNFIKTPFLDYGFQEHDRSWFSIVTETEIEGPWRVTEKPFKPLLGFHPAIILGNPRSLELIRSFGFKTFDGFIDESYDREPDPRRRYGMVVDEVRRLCSLGPAGLWRTEQEMREILLHNGRWGLMELPAIYREKTDPALLAEVLALLEPQPVGA